MFVTKSTQYLKAITPLRTLNFTYTAAKIESKNRLNLQNFVKRACKCFIALAPGRKFTSVTWTGSLVCGH
jgi:hypothetical protein